MTTEMTGIADNDIALAGNLPSLLGPPTVAEWEMMRQQVDVLAKSTLVPPNLRGKPNDLMVITLTARELQIPPMMALTKVHVIDGRPTLSAELMLALVLRAGHHMKIVEQSESRAVVECRRRGDHGEPAYFSFTIEDAMRANLPDQKLKWAGPKDNRKKVPNSGVWYEYPKAMLTARTISMACRATFPDVLMGVTYVPEELGADVDPFTGEITAVRQDLITESETRDLYARVDALDPAMRKALAANMRERGLVLGRRGADGSVTPLLPRSRLDQVEEELASLEQWSRVPAVTADQPDTHGTDPDVIVGEIVSVSHPPAEIDADDAELVADHAVTQQRDGTDSNDVADVADAAHVQIDDVQGMVMGTATHTETVDGAGDAPASDIREITSAKQIAETIAGWADTDVIDQLEMVGGNTNGSIQTLRNRLVKFFVAEMAQ